MVAIPEPSFDGMMERIDQALAQINLNTMSVAPPPASEDDLNAAMAAMRIFETPDGARVLEYLASKTVQAAGMPMPLGVDPMQAYAWGQRREGQNDTYFMILGLIKVAKDPQPQEPQE